MLDTTFLLNSDSPLRSITLYTYSSKVLIPDVLRAVRERSSEPLQEVQYSDVLSALLSTSLFGTSRWVCHLDENHFDDKEAISTAVRQIVQALESGADFKVIFLIPRQIAEALGESYELIKNKSGARLDSMLPKAVDIKALLDMMLSTSSLAPEEPFSEETLKSFQSVFVDTCKHAPWVKATGEDYVSNCMKVFDIFMLLYVESSQFYAAKARAHFLRDSDPETKGRLGKYLAEVSMGSKPSSVKMIELWDRMMHDGFKVGALVSMLLSSARDMVQVSGKYPTLYEDKRSSYRKHTMKFYERVPIEIAIAVQSRVHCWAMELMSGVGDRSELLSTLQRCLFDIESLHEDTS